MPMDVCCASSASRSTTMNRSSAETDGRNRGCVSDVGANVRRGESNANSALTAATSSRRARRRVNAGGTRIGCLECVRSAEGRGLNRGAQNARHVCASTGRRMTSTIRTGKRRRRVARQGWRRGCASTVDSPRTASSGVLSAERSSTTGRGNTRSRRKSRGKRNERGGRKCEL